MQPIPYDFKSLLGPGTGAIAAGVDFGNQQANTNSQTASLLEQVASSQQKRTQDAQMFPLKMEHQRMMNEEIPLTLQERRLGLQEKRQSISSKQADSFMNDYIRMGKADGSLEDTAIISSLTKQHGISESHPIVSALQNAYKQGGMPAVEKMKSYISSGGMKEREQRSREEAQLTKQDQLLRSQEARAKAALESREKIEMARLAEKAKAWATQADRLFRAGNFEGAMVYLQHAWEDAVQAGDAMAAERYGREYARVSELATTKARQAQAKGSPVQVPNLQMTPTPAFPGTLGSQQVPTPAGPVTKPTSSGW